MNDESTPFRIRIGANAPVTRYRMIVAYDGGAYAGWQTQADRRTIQGELERVLRRITGQPVRVHGSGRTDAGVHSRGQTAHFDLRGRCDPAKLQLGLNALLDPDIRVMRLTRTHPDFHARFDAVEKTYRYFIWCGPVMPPDLRRYWAHSRLPLDVQAMRTAACRLVGRHDFAAFSANPNREIGGTVRTLHELSVRRAGPRITITARADGFLYRMVRSLVGFLWRVGTGELAPTEAERILASRVRTARVPTAPAHGLFLWAVRYRHRRSNKPAPPPACPGAATGLT